jgi:hypothetical protein
MIQSQQQQPQQIPIPIQVQMPVVQMQQTQPPPPPTPTPQQQVIIQQQQQTSTTQQNDDALSQVMNQLQLSIFKCQLHAYKLLARNQPLPENMLSVLKSKISRPRMFSPKIKNLNNLFNLT